MLKDQKWLPHGEFLLGKRCSSTLTAQTEYEPFDLIYSLVLKVLRCSCVILSFFLCPAEYDLQNEIVHPANHPGTCRFQQWPLCLASFDISLAASFRRSG